MPVSVIETIAQLRSQLADVRRSGATIGLVPTMGALHEGHARLFERAACRVRPHCPSASSSTLFRFDREDDLRLYPRTLDADVKLCESLDVDTIFAPSAAEMYPTPMALSIDVGKLADHLCGKFRPGHFRGVATVVMKLLQIVQPIAPISARRTLSSSRSFRKLVRDFNVPVEIIGVPTVREERWTGAEFA
jgi:pantoate--beta-alanine ligase